MARKVGGSIMNAVTSQQTEGLSGSSLQILPDCGVTEK